jgi:VIT1/CCC1 family predicted Fe2+/Mn2+ transporter
MPRFHRVQARSYIGDMVFGASDGIITTFAIVSGVVGAELSTAIVLIMGFANLFADGISMATGSFLGHESEEEAGEVMSHTPTGGAVATFFAFTLAGLVPLLPYLIRFHEDRFLASIVATGIALFLVGSARTIVTKRQWFTSGLESLAIGSVAAFVAYAVGALLRGLVD